MPRIDTGPTDGPPGNSVPTAWVTLSAAEATELLAALSEREQENATGEAAGWHPHITDSEGHELTIAIE